MVTAKRRERIVDELCNAAEVIIEWNQHWLNKRFVKHPMNQKVHMRLESGICNLCSAPCSSCMHLNLARMESESNGCSEDTCCATLTSQISLSEGDVLSSKSRACETLQHASSEGSILLSVNSSHDLLSKNAESKIMRSSDISDTSDGTEVLPNSSLCGTVADGQPSSKAPPVLDQNTSNLKEVFREVENHDDNTSFINRVNNADVLVSYSEGNLERKNVSCNEACASDLGSKRTGKGLISCNSGMLENQSTDASAHDGLPKGKVPEGPRECINLSLPKGAATGAASEVSNKNSEVEMDKDSKQPLGEGHKISDQVDQDEKNIKSSGLSDAKEQPLRVASADESDDLDIVEHDVKICDICGDAGREDLLAICSKCSDGAEHTYCMQERLQKVPEGDWLCEECKFAGESESQKQDAEVESVNEAGPSIPNSGKKHTENMEVASAPRRQEIEMNIVSPKLSRPCRASMLSRDSSFKNLDKGKVTSTQKLFGNQSGNDILETLCSPTSSMRLHPPKGTLLKSNSFSTSNFKQKLKQVDEVPYRRRVPKEHAACDMEAGSRMICKSSSFKSVIPGRLNAHESKVKMLSSQFSRAQELKGLKPTKERNATEWKKSLKRGHPLVTSTAVSSSISSPKADSKLASASNNRDLKDVQSNGKLSTLTKSASGLARKALETPVISVAASDATRNSSGSGGQKINQAIPKDETLSNASCTADGPSSNFCVLDGLPRSKELPHQVEKSREVPVSGSMHSVTTYFRNLTCRKCKETGHTAEYCTVSSPLSSGVDLSVASSSKEEMRKGRKLKATIEAIEVATLKRPGIHKKEGDMEETDGLSTPKTAVKFEIASEDQHAHAPAVSVFSKTLAIPEPEYIWQGTFEVQKGGKTLDLCGAFQAHLSTCASPKVLEAVKKLPLKLALDEVPRLSIWPTQFQCHGVCEDNIALYFFAEDIESFERSYMGLLGSMIKSDLALKGTVDGVELLIFPSNVLPKNCQRWNMLSFLWGVFRGKRSNCSVSSNYIDPSKKLGVFNSKAVPTLNEIPNSIPSFSGNICSATLTRRKNSPVCESSCNVVQECDKTCVTANGDRDKEVCLMEHRVLDLQSYCKQEDSELESKSSSNIANSMASLCPKKEPNNPPEDREQHINLKKPSVLAIETKGGSVKSEKIQSNALLVKEGSSAFNQLPIWNGENGTARYTGEVEVADRMLIYGDGVKRNLGRDDRDINIETLSAGSPTIEGLNSKHRKRPYLDLSKMAPQPSNDTVDRLPWNELNTVHNGESVDKKLKVDFREACECNRTEDVTASRMHDIRSGCSIEDGKSEESCVEKVILEDLGSAERSFFPVVAPLVTDFQLEDKPIPWKRPASEDQNRSHNHFPDLELALGADRKPTNKGILPFFVGTVDRNNNQNHPFDKMADAGAEDDPAASLSLSLSFPFKDKEQPLKSVSKKEQVLPEKHTVNTSLLLFGGLSDK